MKVSTTTKPGTFCPGVRNLPGKQRLNAAQLNQILMSLRQKTGWQSLKFDEDGFLVCPNPQIYSGGSESARQLLSEAIFGNKGYDLEAHNYSSELAFARLMPATITQSHRTGEKITSYSVEIDFADFHQLSGHEPARAAFDSGIAVLHELAHGVWRLRDAAIDEEEPGECESYINRIRRELNLPERQQYIAAARLRSGALNRTQLVAELQFLRIVEKEGQAKRKRYFLRWEVKAVGNAVNRVNTGQLARAAIAKQTGSLSQAR